MQAGFEYIKQWFRETQGQEFDVDQKLPDEVKQIVEATLTAAQDSWLRYPSREEADRGEELIKQYARVSYEINRDQVWPEFKKLVDLDLEDQQMQEALKDMQQKGEGTGESIPKELKDKLTPKEQKALEDAIEKAIDEAKKESAEAEAKGGKPIDLDSLSEKLKQKIKDYIESLSEDQKKDLSKRAEATLKEFEQALNKELQGKLTDNPEKKAERKVREQTEAMAPKTSRWEEEEEEANKEKAILRKKIWQMSSREGSDPYERALSNVGGMIDALTGDLRDVFVKRKRTKMETDYRHGRRWNIKKRIKEKIANIPLLKTESREQPESQSEEKDYVITLLVDLSGSMRGEKIKEAFKSVVVLSETLQNLDIRFEVVGFQDTLLEFKSFENEMNDEMRKKLNQLLLEVEGNNPDGHNNPFENDDGACLKQASAQLAHQAASNKFLIVLSDGYPEARGKSRERLDRELKAATREITQNTNQKLIGIGLLSDAVSHYYENNLPNVTTNEMVETLSEVLRAAIEKS